MTILTCLFFTIYTFFDFRVCFMDFLDQTIETCMSGGVVMVVDFFHMVRGILVL